MNERIARLLRQYDEELGRFTTKRIEDAADGENSLGHLRWMITVLLTEAERDGWSDRKVNRWLGFIQGTMWMAGVRGIQRLRNESRHLYDEPV